MATANTERLFSEKMLNELIANKSGIEASKNAPTLLQEQSGRTPKYDAGFWAIAP